MARWWVSGVVLLFAMTAQSADMFPIADCQACHARANGPDIHAAGSHPVDLDYEVRRAMSGGTLRSSHLPSGFGSTIENDLLRGGRVVCTSCHITHGSATAMPFLLRSRPNAVIVDPGRDYQPEYIALCTACHEMKR